MQPEKHQTPQDDDSPRDELDVAYSILRPSEYNDLLEQVNFGTGYYDDGEHEMQMRNVRKALVTEVSFNRTLRKHAVQETKVKLADEGFRYYDEKMQEPKVWRALDESDYAEYSRYGDGGGGRTTALLLRGDEIWRELADAEYALSVKQAAAIQEKTGLAVFKSIFGHLAAAFHEMTKSKGARTQDNFFGRVERHEMHGDADESTRSLLNRGQSQ